jgi:hypothetical protein
MSLRAGVGREALSTKILFVFTDGLPIDESKQRVDHCKSIVQQEKLLRN